MINYQEITLSPEAAEEIEQLMADSSIIPRRGKEMPQMTKKEIEHFLKISHLRRIIKEGQDEFRKAFGPRNPK